MRRRVEILAWPLAAGAGAILPLVGVLAAGRTLVWRDAAQLYAPHRTAVVEALRSLRLPAWNPWEGTGQPLLAQGLDAVLHPVSLLLAPFTASVDALAVASVFLAAVGTWTAARTLGASRAAATAAALAFGLSGYVLAMTANTVFLVGSASAPWTLAGCLAAARSRSGWIAAAAGSSLLALSGDVGSMMATGLAGAALAWAAGRGRGLWRAVSGAALGVALAGIQLVPSAVYLAETTRGAGLLDPGSVHRWALAPWRLLELAAPGLLVGAPRSYVAPVFAALAGEGGDRFPFASSVFVGAPVMLLALLGAWRTAAGRVLLALALVFLWLALGHHAGSQQLLSSVPVWGTLRYWEKMVGPFTLCVALASALGVDALGDGGVRLLGRMTAIAAGVLGVGLFLFASVSREAVGSGAVGEVATGQLRGGAGQAAMALAALGLAVLTGRRWPRVLGPATAGVFLVAGVAASPFALHAGSRGVFATRPPRLDATAPGARLVSPLGFDFVEGAGGLDAIDRLQHWEARSARPSTNVAARVDSLATYTGLTSTRWEAILGAGELFWPLARRFATTHVVARPPASEPEERALRAATAGATRFAQLDGGQLLVWEVPHRPWAAFAPAVRVAPAPDAAAVMLGEELSLGRPTVVLEARSLPPVSGGRVLEVVRRAEEVVVEAEADGDGVLVVNDAFAPGWTATLDGAAVEILPADVLVRAVHWPAGRHRLVMRYTSPGLGAGVAVSAIALAVALAGALWPRWRSRPGAPGTLGGGAAPPGEVPPARPPG